MTRVFKVRPADVKGDWMCIRSLGELDDHTDDDTIWEVEVGDMTEEEIENLPEHEGW